MTVEEIDILVQANIEGAVKEFQKLVPEIRKQVKQIKEQMNNTNFSDITGKVQQAVKLIKQKIANLKNSNKSNVIEIKATTENASKQISQLQKQIDSLQEKINARQMKLNVITPRLDEITAQTIKGVTPNGVSPNNPAIQQTINNSLNSNKEYTSLIIQEEKMTQEIAMYNKQLSEAKNKMSQLKQETEQTGTSQNKLASFFSAFKSKLDQAKGSVGSLKNSFSQMPKMTQNITNNIKNISKGLKNGIGHILKYATALFSIRGIYNILSNSAQSWLSSQNTGAQQLSANIEYMKYAMGSALAPVIQFITNLVYQLMKAIQSVAYALTGVNIFAKATASSMNNVAGSAKKANKETKQLVGIHNEINNVQTQNDSDNSSGSGAIAPSFDLTHIDNQMSNWISNIKEKFSTLFEPIKKSWEIYGKPLIESMRYAFNSNIELIKSMGKSFEEVWTNGTGEHTVSTILQILTSIFNIIGNINIAFKTAWENSGGTEIIQQLWNGFNNLLDIIKGVFTAVEEWTASQSFQDFANAIIGICNTLSYWFELITQKLKEIWDNGGKETFTKLLEIITKIVQVIDAVLKALTPVVEYILSIVTPIIEGIIKTIGYLLDAIGGILDFIVGVFTGDWEKAWNGISEFFTGIWNAIKSIIETVLNAISNIWNSIWSGIGSFISNIWNGITSIISNVINGIKNTISNVLNMISKIWNNIWNGLKTTVSNIFNGIWNVIKGVINSILSGIEGMANGVIKGINWIIKALNGLSFDVPDWVPIFGGKKFGFNLSTLNTISLPRLEKGGVLYEETPFIGGEYSGASNNPEIVTPESKMEEVFSRVLSQYQNNNEQPIYLTVNVGNEKLGQILLDDLRNRKRRTGKNLEALVGG